MRRRSALRPAGAWRRSDLAEAGLELAGGEELFCCCNSRFAGGEQDELGRGVFGEGEVYGEDCEEWGLELVCFSGEELGLHVSI